MNSDFYVDEGGNTLLQYDLDLLDDEYTKLEGSVYSFDELQEIICKDKNIVEFVGRIKDDNCPEFEVCIATITDVGIFIGIAKDKKEYLSLKNRDTLTELIDVWGDELNVSRGLFVDADKGLSALNIILKEHTLCDMLAWITPDQLPEGSNYII